MRVRILFTFNDRMYPAILGIAVAPGVAIALFVYWRDKFEREPLILLGWCFFLGCLTIIPAILLEGLAWELGLLTRDPLRLLIPSALHSLFIIAGSEELSKFLALRIYAYPKPEFNEPFDGITYSVMVAMGFATQENLLYVLNGGLPVAFLRTFMAVPAHAISGIFMGYFLGLAKFRGNSLYLQAVGLATAALFHGLYDTCLIQKEYPSLIFGSFLAVLLGALLSWRAMRMHNRISPFNPEVIAYARVQTTEIHMVVKPQASVEIPEGEKIEDEGREK